MPSSNFVDYVKIFGRSGNGGSGSSHFRREKFVEFGGPDGGDGETGVEMEALTAVSVAALTVYDMCKAVQRDMRIDSIHLLYKEGGKSGVYEAEE